MRNPKWHRDEIILALDLYFSPDRGSIDKNNPKIIELSKILNALPLFPDRPDEEKFRNENGVTLKLTNFLSFDPNYFGKGMSSGSILDKLVFEEFYNKKDQLKFIANSIKEIAKNEELKKKIYSIEDDEQTKSDSVMEGQVLYKLHKIRERDPSIISRKKEQIFSLVGKLSCEVCVFEFEEFYGDIGKGFIECHHKIPLYSLGVISKTSLDDLALVCSNCHRMIHRSNILLTVEELRLQIKYERKII